METTNAVYLQKDLLHFEMSELFFFFESLQLDWEIIIKKLLFALETFFQRTFTENVLNLSKADPSTDFSFFFLFCDYSKSLQLWDDKNVTKLSNNFSFKQNTKNNFAPSNDFAQ